MQHVQQKTRFELFSLNRFILLAYRHVSYTRVAPLNHCSLLQCRVPLPVVQGCRKDAGSSRRALSACGGNRWGTRGRVAMDSRALRRCLAKDCEPDQQATYLTKRRLCPAFYVKAELLNSWIQVLYIIYINIHIIYIMIYNNIYIDIS